MGRRVNRAACDTTKLYCNGGQKPGAMAAKSIGPVSLQQVSPQQIQIQ
jgi:hypothetical protein